MDIRAIAGSLSIAESSAKGYAWRAAEDGLVSRFDVIAALSPGEQDDYLSSKRSSLLGELYSQLWEIETKLHAFSRFILEREYGEGEEGWWVKGVPEKIRQKCQGRREEDPDRLEAYFYIDLLDTWDVLNKSWKLFGGHFAKREGKRTFETDFRRLNQIRNWVMHPAKGRLPSLDDFRFVRDFHSTVVKITN